MLGSWVPAAPINHLSSSKCRWSKKVSLNKVVLFLIYDKVWFLIKSINSVDELHCGYDKRIRGSKPSPVQIRIVSKMKVYLTKAVLLNFGYEAFLTIRAPEVILKDTPLYGGLSLTKVLSHGTYLVFTSYLWWISIEKLLLIKQYAFVLVFWRYAPATLFTCGDWASEK